MKFFVLLLLFALTAPVAAQSPFGPKPKPAAPAPPEEIYKDLEEMPQYPGGPEAMQKYLTDNISQSSMRKGCSGRKLIASFVVEKDGSLSQVDIFKSIEGCPDFDFEVMRVIKTMPKWIPARLKGNKVRCYYKMPVYIG